MDELTATEREFLALILDRFIFPWGMPTKVENQKGESIARKLGLPHA